MLKYVDVEGCCFAYRADHSGCHIFFCTLYAGAVQSSLILHVWSIDFPFQFTVVMNTLASYYEMERSREGSNMALRHSWCWVPETLETSCSLTVVTDKQDLPMSEEQGSCAKNPLNRHLLMERERGVSGRCIIWNLFEHYLCGRLAGA